MNVTNGTMGCPSVESRECDACNLDRREYIRRSEFASPKEYGSFAEGCMLPIFSVWNELNEAIDNSVTLI